MKEKDLELTKYLRYLCKEMKFKTTKYKENFFISQVYLLRKLNIDIKGGLNN